MSDPLSQLMNWQEDETVRQLQVVDATDLAQALIDAIEAAIAEVRVHHVGSTAVPGLTSKRMVDLLAVGAGDLRQLQQALVAIGFHRRDVWVDTDDKPYVGAALYWQGDLWCLNVHCCAPASRTEVDMLRFRDRLRVDAGFRQAYAEAKQRAYAAVGPDPRRYNEEKSGFIQAALAAAEES